MYIANYHIEETLHQGKTFAIYRTEVQESALHYILKVLDKSATLQMNRLGAIKKEYDYLAHIESRYVIKTVDWVEDEEYAVIVLEDIQGKSLQESLQEMTFSMEQFFELAIRITSGLADIHQHNIIHQDINPSNIIWNSETDRLHIIDFDIATTYDLKISHLANPEKLQGTLPYLSPEQTGRMNRTVDQRSDLYSLGATFYEMLTGQKPFTFADPMELVYAHLARDPKPPHTVNTQIPDILSKLVLKLLSKDPEDRYQSAEGLKHDLQKIQETIPTEFSLGEQDFSGKLHISEKLYGREQEIQQLRQVYHDTCQGAKGVIFVTGYSGTGKTSLVNEIHRQIPGDRAYFLSGKFDHLQRNIPYSAFQQAFQQFCHNVLTEEQDTLLHWKQVLLQALGNLGKLLTDIIPNLELIIGKQPAIPDLPGEEARERFNYVFLRFMQVIATKEHPLVVFIDDLQWADLASLNLLQLLLREKSNTYLLFIGAYRDNEVSSSHPLMTAMEKLRSDNIAMNTIQVKNLSLENISEWLQDTLRTKAAKKQQPIESLARHIYQKTQGNAFFTTQFLQSLYRENLIVYDFTSFSWLWDISKIEALNFTDNVIDLLVNKILTLSPEVQEVLQFAACIGNNFDIETLSVILPTQQTQLRASLDIAIREQFIYPFENETYKFVHDRILQASYSLIPEKEKKSIHLKIGRLLLETVEVAIRQDAVARREERIFDIANHFNIGLDLVQDPREKGKLAQLYFMAGHKAKTATAYRLSCDYLRNALTLLPQDSWKTAYDETLAVYNEAIQASYSDGNYDFMNHLADVVIQNTTNVLDNLQAYEFQIMSFNAQNQALQSAEAARNIFTRLGVPIPESTNMFQMMLLYMKISATLKAKGGDSALINLPPITDPEKSLAMRLYLRAAQAIFFGAPKVYPIVVMKMIETSLKYGMSPIMPHILAEYGIINLFMGNITQACRFGQLATNLADKITKDAVIKERSLFLVHIYFTIYQKPIQEAALRLLEMYQYALEAGDLEFAGLSLPNSVSILAFTDEAVSVWRQKAYEALEAMQQLKHDVPIAWIEILCQFADQLCAEQPQQEKVIASESILEKEEKEQASTITLWRLLFNFALAHLFEHYAHISDYVDAVEGLEEGIKGTFHYTQTLFFSSLALLKLVQETGKHELRKRFLRNLKAMKHWAKHKPGNFLHKQYLLEAEYARIQGKLQQAGVYYEKAIENAHHNKFLFEEALASEFAARFYLAQQREYFAEIYLQKAWQCYRRWGAIAKVKYLEEHYPKYLRPSVERKGTTSTETTGEQLDVNTLLKASHTLSGEVQLSKLFEKMLQILIENAGARRGVFLEVRGARVLIQADGSADGIKGVLQAAPMEEAGNVPLSVINYVARSKQPLVFDHLAKETTYAHDPYIQQQQPVSAVCFPVLKQGELAAILYLENDLVEGAFTPARLEILNLLSAQIAISVENAELYEHLEEKVRQRTAELRQAHADLEQTHAALAESHKAITDSVNYASRIQSAVLPADDLLTDLLPEHFILFQPRSVVSGDFYWVRQIEERLIAAVADCTGHGVPGALVSMLGMAFLNELVPQLGAQGRLQAGPLLDALREKVKTAFKQEGKIMEQKDGMDIALCIFEPGRKQLYFAGAYNPLYLIRDGLLTEIKADRMPIGVHRREKPFSTQDVELHPGDRLYLFSDGYADQDGGPDRTGFSKARFQELLLDIHQEPLERQKTLLLQRFTTWKGDLPQRDDVLVFGLRV